MARFGVDAKLRLEVAGDAGLEEYPFRKGGGDTICGMSLSRSLREGVTTRLFVGDLTPANGSPFGEGVRAERM